MFALLNIPILCNLAYNDEQFLRISNELKPD